MVLLRLFVDRIRFHWSHDADCATLHAKYTSWLFIGEYATALTLSTEHNSLVQEDGAPRRSIQQHAAPPLHVRQTQDQDVTHMSWMMLT